MKLKAFCFASGHIQFGYAVPRGALIIATGEDKSLREFIETKARHARVGTDLFVPGVPEADNEEAGMEALEKFLAWIRPHGAEKDIKVFGLFETELKL